MNENNPNTDSNGSTVKAWLEDNLRVLLSILIVVAIAGGIYSYSKRSQAPTVTDIAQDSQDSLLEQFASDQEGSSEMKAVDEADTKDSAVSGDKQVTSVATETSKETENSFIESAKRGDGVTHLARRATANYLEKNPDSTLTREHKIYIEDYLRKNVQKKNGLAIGSSVEFQKDLIKGAIEKSKQLNDKQLQNLKKYSARAPSLK
ncbi:MAG: hypothetical protein PHT88_02375 [Candidatus Moranbacteria bacterium]|nr:hypothetical protein [Candidatus Moranbacteria bacterium]